MNYYALIIASCIVVIGSAFFHHRGGFSLKGNKTKRVIGASINDLVDNAIKNNKVMVFSKTYCPHCTNAKNALTQLNVKFEVFELDVR